MKLAEKMMKASDKAYKKMWDLIVKECKYSKKHTEIFQAIDEYLNAELEISKELD